MWRCESSYIETMGGHDGPKDTGSPNLNQLVRDIQPRRQASLGQSGPTKTLRAESLANTEAAAKELIKK